MQTNAIDLIKTLQTAGYKAYFAGGCVRDMLLGFTPKDFDIVTDAKPEQIEQLFPKTIPIGKQFGIIQVHQNGHQFEVATFRSDSGFSDGRRPDAVIFTSPEQDALRRDFTINGMFYDPLTEKVYDYVGGQKDLENRLIRFIGEPEQRIEEDHLRLLRAVRFKNQFDFQYDPATYLAIKKFAPLIKSKVSAERIRDEFCKMLLDKTKPSAAFEDLSQLRILELIIPELEKLRGCAQPFEYHHEGDVWTHTMNAIDSLPPEASLNDRLATLFHDIGKPDTFKLAERIRFDSHASIGSQITQKILQRLKFSSTQIEAITWAIQHHMMMGSFENMPEKRLKHWFSNPNFPTLLSLMYADAAGTTPTDLSLYQGIANLYKIKTAKKIKQIMPYLSGAEIMEITGLKTGAKVGDLKEAIFQKQLDHQITSKKQAIAWLKQQN